MGYSSSKRERITRGRGTSAARRARKSRGSNKTRVVPSRQGVFSEYARCRPLCVVRIAVGIKAAGKRRTGGCADIQHMQAATAGLGAVGAAHQRILLAGKRVCPAPDVSSTGPLAQRKSRRDAAPISMTLASWERYLAALLERRCRYVTQRATTQVQGLEAQCNAGNLCRETAARGCRAARIGNGKCNWASIV